MLLILLACAGPAPTDDTDVQDTGPAFHPNAPDQETWDRWALSLECQAQWGNGDTRVYKVGTLVSDADGGLTGSEKWYWFYGGDWADDDVDTFTYEGSALTLAEVQGEVGPADEGFMTLATLADDQSRQHWGDGEADVAFYFDYLGPSGNLNLDNKMIVYRGAEGYRGWDVSEYSASERSYYQPDGEIGGAATWIWEAQDCR